MFKKILTTAIKFSNMRLNSNLTITATLKTQFSSSRHNHKKVFLFGGQGNQQKGMLQKYLTIPKVEKLIKQQGDKLDIDLLEIGTSDKNDLINKTQYTQPLLLLSHYLEYHFVEKIQEKQNLNSQKVFCIGHSLGQYSALMISQSISLSDCLKLVHQRGNLMMKASQGHQFGSLIIKYRQDKQKSILKQAQSLNLQVACYNSPTNMVISGSVAKINQLKSVLKQKLKIASKLLPVSTAFHCRNLESISAQFQQVLKEINWATPKYKVLRNIDCKIYTDKEDIINGLTLQNTRPVMFKQSINQLITRQGVNNVQFFQIGHKKYLNRWVEQVVKIC